MKLSIYSSLCLLLLFAAALAEDAPTHLSYFVEYEVEQQDDFIQVEITIDSQSRSLVEAIKSAKATASEIALLANNYCKQNVKKGKGDCKEAVEISQFQIDPKYKTVRKQATFETFIVSHEITIKVFNTENIGYLIDSFLKYPDLVINKFDWLALVEVEPEEEAIKEGIQQGEGLCEQVGLTLGRVINIEEIIGDQDQEKESPNEEEEEEQEEEEEAQIITYKFEVECIPGSKKAKAK